MKKFLLIAVAAMGLLFTACSKDEVAQPVGGEESVVTFTISTPELATRAHGDGLTATVLKYAVYNRVDGSKLFEGEPKTLTNKTAIVDIPFVNGMEYDILFWAEAPTSPYTVNFDAKTVAYTDATALVSNSEAYDAFYAYVNDIPVITGPVTKTVELKRPFAQLNIKTNDATEAAQSGVTVKDVKVVVEGAYTDFDLANHKGLTKGTVTFGTAAKLGDETLAVNYLFPAAEKSLVDVEFTYTDVAGKLGAGEVKEFATVPIQRNYRTNIVGSLLTSEGTLNVVILPGFDGENEHSIVTVTPEDDVNALIRDPEVTTIELGAGEYEIELYNLAEKKTLTINGTDGTQIKFKDQQVRASQFDELVINNCEILRMATKSWGHLVFGSSDNAQGVYTISNCTFNGVGTQGIYINENTSGVTYNILNCTFNGNFGNEGAITIQTNPNVNHIVNVKGCTFNNIPDTSHKIFLASWDGQGSFYYGWTLNTDLKVTTTAELKSFIKLGLETINLADGTFAMTEVGDLHGKTLTFVGSANTVIDASAVDARNQFVTGATLAFEGVTINFGTANYMGFANCSSLSYKDCDINGLQFLYNPTTFENCKFNSNGAEHSVWTYSSKETKFTNCEFTYGDRCVNVYVDNGNADAAVDFTNCTFATTNTTSKGAVEINSSAFPLGVTVALNDCTAPAYGKMVYISEWDPTYGETATVTVYNKVANTEALAAAIAAGATSIGIKGEIDLKDVILSGYNGTIVGADDTAVLNTRNFNPSIDEAYQLRSQNLTFKNISFKLPTNINWLQSGFVGTGAIVFDNCSFEGQATLNGSATWTFNNCSFVSVEGGCYASFVYGATKATYNKCAFSGVDRAAKVYGTGGTIVAEYNECTFTSSSVNKNGIEIDASFATTTVNINNCSQTGMAGLYALKGSKGTVYVDGNQQ